jgi:hypothetical protein
MVMAAGLIDQIGFDTYETKPNGLHVTKQRVFGNHGEYAAKKLIGDALKSRVNNIDHEFCEPGDEDAFFVADLGHVYRQYLRWKLNLPRVKPFYGKPTYERRRPTATDDVSQLSNATRTTASWSCSPSWELGSTAPLKPRLIKS